MKGERKIFAAISRYPELILPFMCREIRIRHKQALLDVA